MPQPVKCKRATFSTRSVANRPELAARIGAIAGCWAWAEHTLGDIMIEILGTTATGPLAMYLALTANVARAEAMKAAAKERLPSHLYEAVLQTLKRMKTRAGERNAVVHGFWGTSDEYPDSLLLAESRSRLLWRTEFPMHGEISEEDAARFVDSRPKYQRYILKDLQDIEDRVNEMAGHVAALHNAILIHFERVHKGLR